MVTYVDINGFDAFDKYTQTIDPKGPPVVFYFSGSKTPDGNSWCPDCVEGSLYAFSHCSEVQTEHPYLNNYEEFVEFAEKLSDKKKNVYFMFTGARKENAEPIVKAYLGELQKNIIFAYVDVGDREYWKQMTCPFRTDPRTKLMVIPTIIKWKGVQRLEGSQCNKRDLLQMLFEEDDE